MEKASKENKLALSKQVKLHLQFKIEEVCMLRRMANGQNVSLHDTLVTAMKISA